MDVSHQQLADMMADAMIRVDNTNPFTGSSFNDFLANELYPNSPNMQNQWKEKSAYLWNNDKHVYSVKVTRLKPEDVKND